MEEVIFISYIHMESPKDETPPPKGRLNQTAMTKYLCKVAKTSHGLVYNTYWAINSNASTEAKQEGKSTIGENLA